VQVLDVWSITILRTMGWVRLGSLILLSISQFWQTDAYLTGRQSIFTFHAYTSVLLWDLACNNFLLASYFLSPLHSPLLIADTHTLLTLLIRPVELYGA